MLGECYIVLLDILIKNIWISEFTVTDCRQWAVVGLKDLRVAFSVNVPNTCNPGRLCNKKGEEKKAQAN